MTTLLVLVLVWLPFLIWLGTCIRKARIAGEVLPADELPNMETYNYVPEQWNIDVESYQDQLEAENTKLKGEVEKLVQDNKKRHERELYMYKSGRARRAYA